MTDDESQIRALIERWAHAVHTGDLETVLADHAPDLVMYDVPPPYDGIRGIDAYRDAWPPFFEWQRGAMFEIVELDVTAGTDVAFAHALLRCDTTAGLANNPDNRLRLTIGLRKVDGRWTVTHEHHSFAIGAEADAEDEIRAVHAKWTDRTEAKDLDGLMENIDPDVVSYEHVAPLSYVGRDAVREVCRRGLESSAGVVSMETPDLTVRVGDDLAVSWGIDHIVAEGVGESWSRSTRVFHKRDGEWSMIHQHLSFPLT